MFGKQRQSDSDFLGVLQSNGEFSRIAGIMKCSFFIFPTMRRQKNPYISHFEHKSDEMRMSKWNYDKFKV